MMHIMHVLEIMYQTIWFVNRRKNQNIAKISTINYRKQPFQISNLKGNLIFFILLKPQSEFSENYQGDLNDPNNPWVLTTKYHQLSGDGNINPKAFLVEEPDEYTNLFSSYANSLLAVVLFLLGILQIYVYNFNCFPFFFYFN